MQHLAAVPVQLLGSDLPHSAVMVALAVSARADDDGWCSDTQDQLAGFLKTSRQRVNERLRMLRDAGWLDVEPDRCRLRYVQGKSGGGGSHREPKASVTVETPMPSDFPSADLIREAADSHPGVDLDIEARRCRSHYATARARSWPHVWRAWVGRAAKEYRDGPASGRRPAGAYDPHERALAHSRAAAAVLGADERPAGPAGAGDAAPAGPAGGDRGSLAALPAPRAGRSH